MLSKDRLHWKSGPDCESSRIIKKADFKATASIGYSILCSNMDRMGPWDLGWGHRVGYAWEHWIPRLFWALRMTQMSLSPVLENSSFPCSRMMQRPYLGTGLWKWCLSSLRSASIPLTGFSTLIITVPTWRNYCFWFRRKGILHQWIFGTQWHVSSVIKETCLGMGF